MSDRRYIAREDRNGYGGWQVRIRSRQYSEIRKSFSDFKHGSSHEAFAAAVKWRDEVLEGVAQNLGVSRKSREGVAAKRATDYMHATSKAACK